MNSCVIFKNMLFLKVLNTHFKRLTKIFLYRLCKISRSDRHGFERWQHCKDDAKIGVYLLLSFLYLITVDLPSIVFCCKIPVFLLAMSSLSLKFMPKRFYFVLLKRHEGWTVVNDCHPKEVGGVKPHAWSKSSQGFQGNGCSCHEKLNLCFLCTHRCDQSEVPWEICCSFTVSTQWTIPMCLSVRASFCWFFMRRIPAGKSAETQEMQLTTETHKKSDFFKAVR